MGFVFFFWGEGDGFLFVWGFCLDFFFFFFTFLVFLQCKRSDGRRDGIMDREASDDIAFANLNMQDPFILEVWHSGTLCYYKINLKHPQTFGRESIVKVR